MRRFLIAVVCLALLVSATTTALARGASDLASERVSQWVPEQRDAERTLFNKPKTEWSAKDIDAWTYTTLELVYWSLSNYVITEGKHPRNLAELTNAEYLPHSPLNPLNNWKPVELRYETGFHAGDLFVQVAPYLSYVNHVKRTKARLTFTLGIFGDSESYKPETGPVLFEDKFGLLDWSVVPPGTAYLTAMRRTSVEQRDAAYADALKEEAEAGK